MDVELGLWEEKGLWARVAQLESHGMGLVYSEAGALVGELNCWDDGKVGKREVRSTDPVERDQDGFSWNFWKQCDASFTVLLHSAYVLTCCF